ncbi:MAG: hypothetical protein LBI99_06550 [Propionibacteriaceae bacterium]|jgi:hypothetical protein|nr:hypothetical protein [Propionibacteriaceae bacterium]
MILAVPKYWFAVVVLLAFIAGCALRPPVPPHSETDVPAQTIPVQVPLDPDSNAGATPGATTWLAGELTLPDGSPMLWPTFKNLRWGDEEWYARYGFVNSVGRRIPDKYLTFGYCADSSGKPTLVAASLGSVVEVLDLQGEVIDDFPAEQDSLVCLRNRYVVAFQLDEGWVASALLYDLKTKQTTVLQKHEEEPSDSYYETAELGAFSKYVQKTFGEPLLPDEDAYPKPERKGFTTQDGEVYSLNKDASKAYNPWTDTVVDIPSGCKFTSADSTMVTVECHGEAVRLSPSGKRLFAELYSVWPNEYAERYYTPPLSVQYFWMVSARYQGYATIDGDWVYRESVFSMAEG